MDSLHCLRLRFLLPGFFFARLQCFFHRLLGESLHESKIQSAFHDPLHHAEDHFLLVLLVQQHLAQTCILKGTPLASYARGVITWRPPWTAVLTMALRASSSSNSSRAKAFHFFDHFLLLEPGMPTLGVPDNQCYGVAHISKQVCFVSFQFIL